MAYLIADLAYLLAALGYLAGLLLCLEWVVHWLPGTALHPLRRGLYRASFPMLLWSDKFLPAGWGPFNSRGLLLAAFFFIVSRYAVPWLVLFSFSLRG